MDINNISIEEFNRFKEFLNTEELDQVLKFKRELNNPLKEESLEKAIVCPHEIIFTINANVLTENEKGELTSTKEICVKNYHIPVPIDKNYQEYMHIFFKYIEEQIINCIDKTDQEISLKKE
jgi:hypothetical protein